MRAAICFLLGLFTNIVFAQEPLPELLWYRFDYPPAFISSGPDKDRGYGDVRDAYLIRELTEYRHKIVFSNVARLFEDIRVQENICNTALLKTPERAQYVVFSEPVAELLPTGIVTLASRKAEFAPFLNKRGELRLQQFIQSQKFRIAVATSRSYGPAVDQALQAGKRIGVVRTYSSRDIFASGLMKLDRRGQADATLGYAVELYWAVRRMNLSVDEYWFVPIEGATQLIYSRVGCSRSPQGLAVVEHINKLIRSGEVDKVFEKAYLAWLPPDLRQYYLQTRKGSYTR